MVASQARPSGDGDLLPASTIAAWQRRLTGFGTRYTGSTGEARFVDFLAAQLERMRLQVHVDRPTFDRWTPTRWELRQPDGPEIPVASYYPYSGETPADGVTAELVYCGTQHAPAAFTRADGTATSEPASFFAAARNAIALVDAPIPVLSSATFYDELSFYPAESRARWPTEIVSPLFQGNANPVDLKAAKAAGVRAVVCAWTNASDGAAAFQYNPFKMPYQGLPALWVTRSDAATAKRLAAAGSRVTLTLTAELTRGAAARSLWCTIPGRRSDEKLIVNTHTDGGNAIEENGGLGLLAIADHYARLDRAEIARDIVFVFVTGHFRQPQFETPGGYGAMSRWKADHPDLWAKASLGVTVEHLGCREWSDEAGTRSYGPTGLDAWSQAFTSTAGAGTPTAPASRLFLEAAQRWGVSRSVAMSSPHTASFLGEGKQFFADGIPQVSLIPIPSYLLRAGPDLEAGKVDHELMYRQIRTMLEVTKRSQAMTARELRGA